MKRTRVRREPNLEKQLKTHATSKAPVQSFDPYEGNLKKVTSTGSTLLDLAISGGVVHGGGLPSGILVEAFGPSSSGKTVLLCEVAGNIQRSGGEIMFQDPEARLNKQFAAMFDFTVKPENYYTPNTVPEVFQAVRKWEVGNGKVNGIFTVSLAALSTDMEMGTDEGDKMGQRRAKEFSQELRRSCRIIQEADYLMLASNQVRVNQNAGPYGQKYTAPGGMGVGFYASLRLRFSSPAKVKEKKTFKGKPIEKIVGIEVEIEVFKSSIDAPYRKAPLIIYFDYGIDDIRANLQYIKKYTGATSYVLMVDDEPIKLGRSLNEAVIAIEDNELESVLKETVIDLWQQIENEFKIERKKKQR